jgi:hypothetical protein
MTLSTNGVPSGPQQQRLTVSNAKPMIQSTSPSDRPTRPDAVSPATPRVTVRTPDADQFSAENSAALRVALAQHPEIRPEVVAKGRALAADPSYPSPEIIRRVSAAILGSPDLTEDNS